MSTSNVIDAMYLLADKITGLVGQRQFENLPDYMKRTAISDAYRSEVEWDNPSDVDDALLTVINEFVSNAETCGVETPLLTKIGNTASDLNKIRLYPELSLDSVTTSTTMGINEDGEFLQETHPIENDIATDHTNQAASCERTPAQFKEDTSVYDEGFLQGLEEFENGRGEPALQSRGAARTKRVYIRDMEIDRDANNGRLATNGGLFKIAIVPCEGEMQNSFRVVASDDRSGTADDLRSLRNLIVDLEGTELPAKQTRSRLPFWKWKAEVTLRILEHPAMGPDGNPRMYPDFDCLGWEDDFLSGMTVEDEYQKADAMFNQYGW